MKIYNVKEIAVMLRVDEETVRRWIRSGKLKSTLTAKKNGNVICEHDLMMFIETRPKYKSFITGACIIPDEFIQRTLSEELSRLMHQRKILDKEINRLETLLKESC